MKTELETAKYAKYAKRRGPVERSTEIIPLRTQYPSQQSPRRSGINSALQWCLSRGSHISRFQILFSK